MYVRETKQTTIKNRICIIQTSPVLLLNQYLVLSTSSNVEKKKSIVNATIGWGCYSDILLIIILTGKGKKKQKNA